MNIKAYAKLNLTLQVLGRNSDGFHDLCSVMQTVSLCDNLRLTKDSEILVACDDPAVNPADNVAFAAANAFFAATGIKGGVAVEIQKNIPVCAGLGGGSADAAAVLNGLNDLYSAGLDYQRLREIAAGIGADVPFCVEGGLALCRGRGELVTQLDALPITPVVIVTEGQKPSTGEMYSRLDASRGSVPKADESITLADDIWQVAQSLHNDFMPLYADAPAAEYAELLLECGAIGASLTGSGPSVFGMFADGQTAQDCYDLLCRRGAQCWLCSTTR